MQKYSDVVLEKNGKGISGATITVTTYPDALVATIYAADGGPAVSSVQTDSAGRFSFYAANGHYSITVSGQGITPITYNDVTLFDPLDLKADAVGYGSTRKVSTALTELGNIKDLGARGDGTTNESPVLLANIGARQLAFPVGTYLLNQAVDFQPWPVTMEGNPASTVVTIGDSTNKYAMRFGASGFGTPDGIDGRQITYIHGYTFKSNVGSATGIKAQKVHPLFVDNVRFFGLGGKAFDALNQYYGRLQNIVFRDSGFNLNDTNNLSIDGGDIGGIPSSPNYSATDFANTMVDSDGVSLHNLTLEGWRNPVIYAERCKNSSLNGVWIESNTGTHIITLKNCPGYTINDAFMDLYPSPTEAIIKVDNSGTTGIARTIITHVNVVSGFLRMASDPVASVPFAYALGTSRAAVAVNGLALDRGHLFGRGDVRFNVRNVTLSSSDSVADEVKSLYSMPNALMAGPYNAWCFDSVNADWDFASGAGLTEVGTSVLTFSTSTAAADVLTGTKSAKVAGIPSNTTRYVIQKLMSDLGPVTVEGQTHQFFVRFKPSVDMSIIFAIEGFFSEYEICPDITFKAGRWYDFVLKTSSDSTWAQGRQGDPKLHLKVKNTSGSTGSIVFDRIDYKTVQGDVYLP